jgi:hypothetical protein
MSYDPSTEETILYHATDIAKLNAIALEGMRPRSYWTNDVDVLNYYEETVADEGKKPVALVINIVVLDAEHLQPDLPGVEEPLTFTLGMSEDEVNAAWDASDKTWGASLNLIKTLRYNAVIEAERIMVMDAAGVMYRLSDYIARMVPVLDSQPASK